MLQLLQLLQQLLGSNTAQLGVRSATSSHLSSPPHSSHPQVADHGLLTVLGSDTAQLGVSAVKKAAGGALFVHSAEVMSGTIKKGAQVQGLLGNAVWCIDSAVQQDVGCVINGG